MVIWKFKFLHLIVEDKEIADDLTQAANGHAMLIPDDEPEEKRGDNLSCSQPCLLLPLNLNLLQNSWNSQQVKKNYILLA